MTYNKDDQKGQKSPYGQGGQNQGGGQGGKYNPNQQQPTKNRDQGGNQGGRGGQDR